jgi:diguanylate cyclase (GGDEF)-like protein/PAS domain S-box-containing protein
MHAARAALTLAGRQKVPSMTSPATPPDSPSPALTDQLVEIVDHLDAMVAYWDANRTCGFANAAYLAWFGKTRAQAAGRPMQELLGPLYDLSKPYIDAAFRGEKQVFERQMPLPDGEVRHSLATYTPRIVDGQVVGLIAHVADVTPLKQAQEALRLAKEDAEARAAHDPLTGLPNRLLLHETLGRAIAAAVRGRESLAVMSIDADHFKEINDSLGHAAGDRLLVELAARIRRSLRACDTVFRVGGDEFVALVPEIGSAGEARALALRILESMRAPLPLAGGPVVAAVSIGIALMPRPGGTTDALLGAADAALYEAKREGRNRVVMSA